MKKISLALIVFLSGILMSGSCSKGGDSSGTTPNPNPPVTPPVTPTVFASSWITTGSQSQLLAQQTTTLGFSNITNTNTNIIVDSTTSYQTVDGFGYTLTDGSAELIYSMPPAQRANLLTDLFSQTNGIGVSYLRLTIGASDLSSSAYTYNDLASGTDVNLTNFSIAPAMTNLIPLLKEIKAINPNIKLLATPWSAPAWMKSNNNLKGGSLLSQYFSSYAQYFVKYIQAMQAEGLTIDAITPQNEPLHDGNNPSMYMTAADQAVFIKSHLGPAFQAANITAKIIIYDHNCDNSAYPLQILNDAAARAYVDGSAFHLYAGDISTLSGMHEAFPNKNVYFTEQYTASTGSFGGDLKWHLKNVIIGSMRNWSKTALEWNLANDPNYGPHTTGGCTTCKGALTINGSTATKNVAYYIIAHASKFVLPGSKKIGSNNINELQNVAFVRPDGKKVLLVENDSNTTQTFNVKFKELWFTPTLEAGAVATYMW